MILASVISHTGGCISVGLTIIELQVLYNLGKIYINLTYNRWKLYILIYELARYSRKLLSH